MVMPLSLTLATAEPVNVKLEGDLPFRALGVSTICESNLQRHTAMDTASVQALMTYLNQTTALAQIWAGAFYPEQPVEAVDIQPYSRAQRGLPCLFSQVGELPEISDIKRFPVADQLPLSCTDQERAFCLLQERIRKLWVEGRPDAEVKLALLADYAGRLDRLGKHHFSYWDGELLFAYSGDDSLADPLAYQLFSEQNFCLKNDLSISFDSTAKVDGVLVGNRSFLGDEATVIKAGTTLCFKSGQLFEQCEPVSFWQM